ncbi:MAG: type II secretion system F family protein [Chloroflexota bacterium]
MNLTLLLIVAGVVIVLLGFVGVSLLQNDDGDALSRRISEYAAREEVATIEEIELSLGARERLIVPMLRRFGSLISRFAPQQLLERITKQLEQAAWTISAAEFMGMALFSVVLIGFAGWYLAPEGQLLLFTLGGLGLGAVLPRMMLGSAVSRRKEAIVKKLPDALDLMTICVEAGLTFDGAMTKVDEKWEDPLSNEFGRVVSELQLGKTRRQSLKDMSDRLDVPDVQTFVASILQADQLGVSVGKVLRIQSDQMRVRRRQRAEEKAQQAPIKMLFPMVFLIFPALFVVLLGPAGIRVWRLFF